MALESEKIRHEIKNILEEKGRLRSRPLVELVCENADVSQKPVYRELQNLVDSEEIKKIEHNRAKIEYESISFEYNNAGYVIYFTEKLEEWSEHIQDWQKSFKKHQYLEQMFALRPLIKALQNIDSEYSIMQHEQSLQPSMELKNIRKLINEKWTEVIIGLQITKNDECLNELFMTLRYEVGNNYRNYQNLKNSPLREKNV